MRLLLFSVVFLTACSTPLRPSPAVLPPDAVDAAAAPVADAGREIAAQADLIRVEVAEGSEANPGLPQWVLIDAYATEILRLTEVIAVQAAELHRINDEVNKVMSQSAAKDAEIARLRQELEDGERRFFLWMLGISALCVAIGTVLAIFVSPRFLGLGVIVLGVVGGAVAKLYLDHAEIMYGIGGGLVLLVFGWVAYNHFILDKRVIPQVMDTVGDLGEKVTDEQWTDSINRTQDSAIQRRLLVKKFKSKKRRMQ